MTIKVELINLHEFTLFMYDNVDVVEVLEDGTIKLWLDDEDCSLVTFNKADYTNISIYKED